jgi:Ca2+-binding EF-hand superfamily protein
MPQYIKIENYDVQKLWEIIKNLSKNNIQEVHNIFKSFQPTISYESLINIVKINISKRELNKISKVYSATTLQQISDKTMLSIDEVKSGILYYIFLIF